MFKPIFYDLETTGLRSTDRIIEIAAYDPIENRFFQQIINPEKLITLKIIKITGIYNSDCQKAPTFDKIIDKFNKFCEGNVCLIAHNNKFDQKFLTREYTKASREIPNNLQFFDTLPWIRYKYPNYPEYKLSFLSEELKVNTKNTHRALDDAKCLYQVMETLRKEQKYLDIINETIIKPIVKKDKKYIEQ